MHRARLRNKFLRNITEENERNYSKRRNLCVSLLQKSKSQYNGNTDERKVTDNIFFLKMVKTSLSDEVASKAENAHVRNENVIDKERKATELLNTFFSNIVGNLNIAEYRTCNPLANEISDPALKAIVKYRNHPSILKIGEACKKIITFSFSRVDKGENFK